MNYYFLINKQTNVVENYIVWGGDQDVWQPPETHFLIPAETTKAIDWIWDEALLDWVAVEGIGNGGIGDVWDGEKVSQVKPIRNPNAPIEPSPNQPTTSGTQEL